MAAASASNETGILCDADRTKRSLRSLSVPESSMTDNSSAPGGRFVTLLVLYLGLFLFAYSVTLPGNAAAEIAATLHVAAEDVWPVFSIFYFAWFCIIPAGAWLADKIGRKPLLIAGSLLLTLGMYGFSVSTSLWEGCAAQFLNGAGAILLQIVGIAAVTDLFAERRGGALNIAVGLVGIIAVLSPVMMGELLQRGVAWTTVYHYSALLPAALFVLQLFQKFPSAAPTVSASGEVANRATMGQLLTDPKFLLLIAAMYVYGIVEAGIFIYSSQYLPNELGASKSLTGYVGSGYWITASLVRLLAGMFFKVDRIPYSKQIVFSAVAAAACVALGTLPHNLTMAVTFLSLSGAAIALIWPSIMALAATTTNAPATTVFGLIVGIGGSLGAMSGAGVLGFVKSSTGLSYEHSLLLLEIPLVLLVAMFAMRKDDGTK